MSDYIKKADTFKLSDERTKVSLTQYCYLQYLVICCLLLYLNFVMSRIRMSPAGNCLLEHMYAISWHA
jgi:hypothetical protein